MTLKQLDNNWLKSLADLLLTSIRKIIKKLSNIIRSKLYFLLVHQKFTSRICAQISLN